MFRSRVVNPKWIASVMRHGYKGAFEMAATVDYLFGYEATAQVIEEADPSMGFVSVVKAADVVGAVPAAVLRNAQLQR